MTKEELGSKETTKSGKSKWCWWTCGGCGCLILLVVAILIVLNITTGFNLGRILTGENGSNKQDAEDKEMSKTELVNYFVTETTVYPGLDKQIKLMKWEKPVITVSLEDTPPDGGTKALDDFVKIFTGDASDVA